MIIGFFGKLGEMIGRQVEVDPPAGLSTVEELKDWLAATYPAAAGDFAGSGLKVAIDDQLVPDTTSFVGVDRVEFFPPISGG